MKGFTLLELMIVVSVMAVLIMGATLVMYKTLSSRGQNQAETNINQAGSQAMEAIEQSVKFSTIEGVGVVKRATCLTAGAGGISGSTLSVSDSWGTTTYSLNASSKIASNSAEISGSLVVVTNLSFTWLCAQGYPDKLRISFEMNDAEVSDVLLKRTFRRDISLYNSGI
jgi:prepilin-type N-terminal cleavage/methylation domain-containing protein